MGRKIWFNEQQLVWLEEADPELFVEIVIQEEGNGEFSETGSAQNVSMHQLRDLLALKRAHPRHNIWRSWDVYRDAEKSEKIGPIPLYFDIDDATDPPNLKNAYVLTATCLDVLMEKEDWAGSSERLRVVFSGRKGFHIEVKPPFPIEAETMRKSLIAACKRKGLPLAYGNVFFQQTVLDTLHHEWVRLTGTVYSWRTEKGRVEARRVLQISVEDFRNLDIEEIVAMSKSGL